MSMQPYPGLRPYEEDERRNFFGREADSKILIDQILANRLTLLFAATGVGKSSLLKASVIPRLKEPLGENLDVVYYNDWVASPLPSLKPVILNTLHEEGDLEKDVVEEDVREGKLPEFLEFCCLFASQPFVIVLDQFEEFFRYRNNYPKEEFQAFIDQLTDVVLNKAIPVAVVLSMREDYALELNAFKPKLPMILFENYYRLEKLTREAAKEAILTPVERIGFKYEPVLFEMLLKDLLSRELDRSKGSMVAETIETVEPPYLQIICSQLWERDQNDPQKTIRFATYEKAGYAKGLLDNYIEKDVLSKFSFQEKQLSSKAFDHLVSRRGTKMPHTVEDLAQTVDVKPDDLQKVLEKLAKNRILRSQQREEKIWYELYHDMFSHSIDDWNTVWKNRMRVRKSFIGSGLAVLAGVIVFVGYDTFVNFKYTHLRMDLNDPHSVVELWQGKKGSWDIFGQQDFIAQTDMQVKDREPDKRLQEWPVNEKDDLTTELIGAMPLKYRVVELAEDGQLANALNIAKDSISGADISRSKDIISSLSLIDNRVVNDLLVNALNYSRGGNFESAVQTVFSGGRANYWLHNKENFQRIFDLANNRGKKILLDSIGDYVLGREYLPILVEHLENDDDNIRISAIEALGKIGCHEVIPDLISFLSSENTQVQLAALNAIDNMGASNVVVPELIFLFNDDSEIAMKVKTMLVGIADAGVLSEILEIIKSDYYRGGIFIAALDTLGKIKESDTVPILIDFAHENQNAFYNDDLLDKLVITLKEIDEDLAFSYLEKKLDIDDDNVRMMIINMIGGVGDARSIALLTPFLKDNNKNIRLAAVDVLGKVGDSNLIPQLLPFLNDKQLSVKKSVINALAGFGDSQVIPILLPLLRDDNFEVRLSVLNALDELGNSNVLGLLFPVLQNKINIAHDGVENDSGGTEQGGLLNELVVGLINESNDGVRGYFAYIIHEFELDDEVVDILIEKNVSGDFRLKVIKALSHFHSQEAMYALIDQAKTGNNEIRSVAIDALGNFGRIEAAQALIPLLKDEGVRSKVISALGALGYPQTAYALLPFLQSDDSKIRMSAIDALGGVGNFSVLPNIIQKFGDDNIEVRISVANALSNFDKLELVPVLLKQLDDDDYVRSGVISLLGELGQAEVFPALLKQLKEGTDEVVKESSANALGDLGDRRVMAFFLEELSKRMSDRTDYFDTEYRWHVINTSCKLKDPMLTPIFIDEIDRRLKSDYFLSIDVGVDCVRDKFYSTELLSLLLKWLQSGNDSIRYQAIHMLGELKDSKAILQLLLSLKDDNSDIRMVTATALGKLGAADSIPQLVELLKDRESDVRIGAAEALGNIGGVTAIPGLIELLQDEESSVRMSAVEALGKIDKSKVKPELLKLLTNDDEGVRSKAINVFVDVGDVSVASNLREILEQDKSDVVKLNSSVALYSFGLEDGFKYLTTLVTHSSAQELNGSFKSAMSMLEGDKKKLLRIVEYNGFPFEVRLEALSLAIKNDPQQIVPDLLRLLQTDEKLYGSKLWSVISDLKVVGAKEILEEHLDGIRQQHIKWRDIRDNKKPIVPDKETEEYIAARQAWEQTLNDNKPSYAFPYAYTLARIDKQAGIELLGDEVAEIRRGAWYGLASLGDVNLVKELADLRWENPTNPLLRHAAYRAIDLSLYKIQENSKVEELAQLEKWMPELKQMEIRHEKIKPGEGKKEVDDEQLSVTSRVDWTINLISYNLKAKAELHHRYEESVAKQNKEANQPAP